MLVNSTLSSFSINSINHCSKAEKTNNTCLSSGNIRGRDIMIINPCCKGGGDEVLAKKIANIALNEGCRVTINSFDTLKEEGHDQGSYKNYSLMDDEPHNVSQLNNPLFIIAPLSIASKEMLKTHFETLCETYTMPKKDIILIEEMDILVQNTRSAEAYETLLREIGFTEVSSHLLGFAEGSIGYIPTDEKCINEIKKRVEHELSNLIDSYNMSFSGDSTYHLGYISSAYYTKGIQVFIINTLCETEMDERSANFIMSLRLFELNESSAIIDKLVDVLLKKNERTDYRSLFSTANIMVINSDNGHVEVCKKITGEGKKEIKIILTNKLPKNIYDDFLLIAEGGMTSGDQSLSEYLTLKGKLPYYDMQTWKAPLLESIKKMAGEELHTYIDQKVTGIMPFSGYGIHSFINRDHQPRFTPEQLRKKTELDQKISSRIATPYIQAAIRSASHAQD